MPTKRNRRIGYAAVAWLVFFALSHILLAIFPGEDPAGGGPFNFAAYLVYDLGLVVMSVLGVWFVLATLKPWGQRIPRWMLLVSLWFGSLLLIVRGVPGLVEIATTLTGLTPYGVSGSPAEGPLRGGDLWSMVAINGAFFLGAVLLTPVAWSYTRRR